MEDLMKLAEEDAQNQLDQIEHPALNRLIILFYFTLFCFIYFVFYNL